jgi:hypothetical protein
MTIDAIAPLITNAPIITSAPVTVEALEFVAKMHPLDVLLSGKTASQKARVTDGCIQKGWIQEGQSYRDLHSDITNRALMNPEKFFAAFGI